MFGLFGSLRQGLYVLLILMYVFVIAANISIFLQTQGFCRKIFLCGDRKAAVGVASAFVHCCPFFSPCHSRLRAGIQQVRPFAFVVTAIAAFATAGAPLLGSGSSPE